MCLRTPNNGVTDPTAAATAAAATANDNGERIADTALIKICRPCPEIPRSNRRPGETQTTTSGAGPCSTQTPLICRRSSLSGLCHSHHSRLTPVCPSLLSRRPISLSVGWSCLVFLVCVFFLSEVCLRGEGIPRCFRPPLVFQLITANMTALLLFGAEPSRLSCPRGESKSSASLPLSPS